jgi:predicted outer membrane repeat protein
VDRDAPGPSHDGLSWTTAYTGVQDALEAAQCGHEIWVAEGVYYPGVDVTSTFMLTNGVTLYGGFAATETLRTQRDWTAHVNVLSGDIDQNDITDAHGVVTTTANITGSNAYHVVYANNVNGTAVLDGFTLTAGKASGSYSIDSNGSGMANSGSNPQIANVMFSGNWANSGGGMANTSNSSPFLTNVMFSGNQATTDGGGMTISINSNPVLTNVTFSDNRATSGGGIYSDRSSPRLTNVTFSGNRADNGGGMYILLGRPMMTNVTFGGNRADTTGGGIYIDYNSNSTLVNSILWGDSPDEIYNSGGILIIAYSDVYKPTGVYSGTGNINADPLFVTPITATAAPTTTGNYRLLAGSPAIDAGNTLSVTAATDLDGNPRVSGAEVDMGAYEYQTVRIYLPFVIKN